MLFRFTEDHLRCWDEEYAKRKTPKGVPSPYGMTSDPNPNDSNAPSHDLPMPGSDNRKKKPAQNPNSYDQGKKPDINDMEWMLGGLDYERDQQTGLAKWPLSFKKLAKDVKLPNGKDAKPGAHPKDQKPEQPPTAV